MVSNKIYVQVDDTLSYLNLMGFGELLWMVTA